MANAALYEPRRFLGERLESIRDVIEEEGWDPILISDPQGAIYPPHRHAAAKLLVFLSGEMRVEAGNAIYKCQPGDQLVIPGDVEHAAWVGPDGCRFFWSEQMRGRL
jgi:anti-sigma factor ChrR (cupin superfamily)